MNVTLLPVTALEVPAEFQRETPSATEDTQLADSIRKGGVQQPLIVLPHGDRYRVVKGTRRLAAALLLGIPKVPCVIDRVPEGEDPIAYARRVRFITDEHRQDLMPSQKAEIIERLKKDMGFTNTDVAAYLGVVPDTVTNWTAPLRYIPQVREAIDSGGLTMRAARVFVGLSEKGQRHILREHLTELTGETGKNMVHRVLRKRYSPASHPDFYRDSQKSEAAIRKAQPKNRAQRSYSADEKRSLLGSVEMKEGELLDGKEEAKTLRNRIDAAIPIVGAIQRNKAMREYVAKHYPNMMDELKAFADSYL